MGLAGFSAVCKQISEGSVLQFLRMRMDADERFDGGKGHRWCYRDSHDRGHNTSIDLSRQSSLVRFPFLCEANPLQSDCSDPAWPPQARCSSCLNLHHRLHCAVASRER